MSLVGNISRLGYFLTELPLISEPEPVASGHGWRVGWRKVIAKENLPMFFVITRGHSLPILMVEEKEGEKAGSEVGVTTTELVHIRGGRATL